MHLMVMVTIMVMVTMMVMVTIMVMLMVMLMVMVTIMVMVMVTQVKRPWGTYEWTRCPVTSCKARYKYNSGSNSLRTIEKHNKKVFGTAKVLCMCIG